MKKTVIFVLIPIIALLMGSCGYSESDLYEKYQEGFSEGFDRAEEEVWEECNEYLQNEFMSSMYEYVIDNPDKVVEWINEQDIYPLFVPADDAYSAFELGFYEAYKYCMYGNQDIDIENYIPFYSEESINELREQGIDVYGVYTENYYSNDINDIMGKYEDSWVDEYGAFHSSLTQ